MWCEDIVGHSNHQFIYMNLFRPRWRNQTAVNMTLAVNVRAKLMLWKQTSLSVTTFLDGIVIVKSLSVVFLMESYFKALACCHRFIQTRISNHHSGDILDRMTFFGNLAFGGLGFLIWILILKIWFAERLIWQCNPALWPGSASLS